MRLVRAIALAMLALVALPAHANETAFAQAVETGAWQGCVFEEGYDPYPIILTPRGEDFFVSYPHLECIGGHNVDVRPQGYDAVEIMVIDTGHQCTTNSPLEYTLQPDGLRIDYFADEIGTYALLRPAPPGAPPPVCNTPEATS
ncbi:hypothetical protein [Henriciella sp.]|uniref:hypothetical protein n=1 Tax=Henriciella sp. TaxID=1968823 RepID=UPI00263A38AC|nr:hypothetical protein [Henriciella sp.]